MSTREQGWAAVVVSVAMIAGVVVLSALDKPATDLMTLVTIGILPVLGAFAAGKLAAVERNTNGNVTQMMSMIRQLQADLAQSAPVSRTDPEVLPAPPADQHR